jgi:Fe2+ transport system protein FeoA
MRKVQEGVIMSEPSTLPLSEAPVGKRVRIRRLSTGPDLSRRLREIGLGEHALVSCVLKGHGNIICAVRNTRIGIDRRLASKIVVSALE